MGDDHTSFTTAKIGSLLDVQSSKDPEGLRVWPSKDCPPRGQAEIARHVFDTH